MRWPAYLSFAAGTITAVLALLSGAVIDSQLRRWIIVIAVPPILASLYQGVQYRRGESANAFWPVAVYLFFIVVELMNALGLYFFGVILQTLAWTLGRRERRRREATQPQETDA
jgi:hypothetical protein